MTDAAGKGAGGNPTQIARRTAARAALLKAAIELLVERGGDAFTLAEVGARAGFSRGLPGHHFSNKANLIQAVTDHLFATFSLRATGHEGVGFQGLLGVLARYFDGLRGGQIERRAFLILMGNAHRDPSLLVRLRELNQSAVERLQKHLAAAARAGDLAEGLNPRRQAILLLSSLRGIADVWMADPEGVNLDELRDDFLASVKRCLGAQAV